jgi:hypothetical protein
VIIAAIQSLTSGCGLNIQYVEVEHLLHDAYIAVLRSKSRIRAAALLDSALAESLEAVCIG